MTMETSRETLQECKHLERVQGSWKEVQWHQRKEQMSRIREQAIIRARSNSRRRPGSGPVSFEKIRNKEDIEEVFTTSHERLNQYVTMGATLTTNCKHLLADILRENMEVFTWTRSESTAVLRFVMDHQLKIYPLVEPMVHKRRPVAPEGRLALKERVFHWLGEGLIRKEYNQIIMAEDDEEKTGFHMKEGVYCFTHMLKELKNSDATLQRMMKKVLANQRGRNVEIHLEDIVIKRKSEQNLIQDIKEMLRKLRKVKIKIDPTMSSFGVNEGKFLGHMFIPKLEELKHPLREARTRIETSKEVVWTNEAEEALRRIKRKLGKLQTLAIPKEGETLMLCLRQRIETISSALLIEREGIQILVSYHKVIVVTDGPIKEILKLSGKEGRLAKWAAEIRTYDISYIPRKEAEGLVMKKFFGQGEHVEGTPDANEGGTFTLNKKLQAKSTPTPRAWRLYVGKETIEEGLGVGIILVSPKEKMHSYNIRLKFHASNHVMDYEALLAGIVVSTNQGMKDLHVFIDSLTLVAQVEGSHTPVTEQERKIGIHKVGISQSGSISGYQNKTIGGRDKQQQEGKSSKQCDKGRTKLQS
ncbi:reverse transcriptase domain-containing protein [Tanacetum coccineum]|uniref:Reverse transcriptase domain-containing protein n=1 Tax=Tanacetum coccineum TaxID=301880 RepID=A0ABQ5DNF5_9ASTR